MKMLIMIHVVKIRPHFYAWAQAHTQTYAHTHLWMIQGVSNILHVHSNGKSLKGQNLKKNKFV